MFALEAPSQYRCQRCDSVLQTTPEYQCSEWFLRCVSCGAKNLFVLTLTFVGWRPAEGDLGHLKTCSLSSISLRAQLSLQLRPFDQPGPPMGLGQCP